MEEDFDVLIVGSGGAGLAAAIEASSNGARVRIFEQTTASGGTSIIAGGGCFIVDSPLQRKLGIRDSVELAINDWYSWSHGTADMEWARFYIERSCPELYVWAETLGVQWTGVMLQEGNSVPRWHRPKGGGKAVSTYLQKEAERLGVKWSFSKKLEKLVNDGNSVVGAEFSSPDGSIEQVSARVYIVATGGFCSSREMVHEYCSKLKNARFLLGGGPDAKGSAHKILSDAGGKLVHMEDVWAYPYGTPDPQDPEARRGLVVRGLNRSIWVNASGKRFHNELLYGGATGTPALLRQKPPMAWAIIDSSIVDEIEIADPRYRDGNEKLSKKILEFLASSPFVKRGESINDIARSIGIDTVELAATIDKYNSYIERGLTVEPEFGKQMNSMSELEEPPFYAIQIFPIARKNLGGVHTDMRCRVLDGRGNSIPRLYAAGEVAGMAGGHINGDVALEGTMFGPSIISGRVAGAWAASEIGFGNGMLSRSIE